MKRHICALITVLLFVTHTHAAPTVLGTGTLNTTDDLTRIQLDGGAILEWLDITETTSMNIPDATTAFSPDGFQVATLPQMNQLLEAFSLPQVTVSLPTGININFTTEANVINFQNYLGTTNVTSTAIDSIGYLDDQENSSNNATIISVRRNSSPNPSVFTNSFGSSNDGTASSTRGVWMVRTGEETPTIVPLPAAAWAGGAMLTGLFGVKIRRKTA